MATFKPIKCPHCGHQIDVTNALHRQFADENKAHLAAALAHQEAEAKRAAQTAIGAATAKATRDLAAMQAQLKAAQEEAAKVTAAAVAAAVTKTQTQTNLALRERDKTIADLREKAQEAERLALQGSMQRQGEAFELDFEDEIGHLFPNDTITEVPKGKNGADVVHRVRNNGRDCGTVVWELKNTKSFQRPWIAKVKADARAAKADLAVIVSVTLPAEVEATGFGLVDGVWVTSPKAWPALATCLREQLVQVANVTATAGGKKSKASLVYDYISGSEFRGRVTALIEAHQGLKRQLDSERTAMQRQWAEREKHLDRLLSTTAAVVGDIHGIAGAEVLPVRGLDLTA